MPSSSGGRTYGQARLYNAPRAFASGKGFLFDVRPEVIAFASPQKKLELPGLPDLGPPEDLKDTHGINASAFHNSQPLKTFNPSIAAAPHDLCPRCAFVMSMRVDALHQCSTASSPYSEKHRHKLLGTDWFMGTAIAVLDARFDLLGWSWMINSPVYQLARPLDDPATSRIKRCVPTGSADHDFLPSWAKQTFDARLLHADGGLLVTYACSSCAFSLSPLRITAEPTADGGLRQLRVWASDRFTYQKHPWIAGRNQALFLYDAHAAGGAVAASSVPPATTSTPRPQLLVQPRLGVIGSLGRPRFRVANKPVVCAPKMSNDRRSPHSASNCKGGERRSYACGTHPDGAHVPGVSLGGMHNDRAKLLNDTRAALTVRMRARGTFGGLSLTTNLLRVRSPASDATGGEHAETGACDVYLGIGHLHRGEGAVNKRLFRRTAREPPPWADSPTGMSPTGLHHGVRQRQPFAFGFRYTHFWYTLEAKPPFAVLAASGEFCLGAEQDATDCESVQFISGLALAPAEAVAAHAPNLTATETASSTLVLAYGINDCEAKLGLLPLERAWRMLRPLSPSGRRCG